MRLARAAHYNHLEISSRDSFFKKFFIFSSAFKYYDICFAAGKQNCICALGAGVNMEGC